MTHDTTDSLEELGREGLQGGGVLRLQQLGMVLFHVRFGQGELERAEGRVVSVGGAAGAVGGHCAGTVLMRSNEYGTRNGLGLRGRCGSIDIGMARADAALKEKRWDNT